MHHHEGDRRRYLELSSHLEIVAFTEDEELFLQREAELWEALIAFAIARGLLAPEVADTVGSGEATPGRPAGAQPDEPDASAGARVAPA
jgi:hypothetical protein